MSKELSTEELRRIELDILKYIHFFCKENQIRYYLCGGTLLGAIRHGGFIPWDDDIDICMPRKDYEIFKKKFKEQGKYKFVCVENTEGYCFPFGKVVNTETVVEETIVRSVNGMGVYVDVFPLDGLGKTYKEAKWKVLCCGYCLKWIFVGIKRDEQNNSLKAYLKNSVYALSRITKKYAYKEINRISKMSKFENSNFVGVVFGFYGEKEIMPVNIFEKQREHKFEDTTFMIPERYDDYLSRLYGKYMNLPPKEKQVTHHSFRAYIKEK